MKKITAVILAALMIAAVLSACKDNNHSDVSLKALLADVNQQLGLSDASPDQLRIIESNEDLDNVYLISKDDIVQFAAEVSVDTADKLEIVIVEAKDSDTAEKIYIRLAGIMDSKLSNAKSYTPKEAKLLEHCKVKTSGNFVYYVISEKYDEIISIIEETLS